MNLTDKHPAEIDFLTLIEQFRELVDKLEKKYVDSSEKEDLERVHKKLNDMQMKRFSAYINHHGKLENIPKVGENIQKEITDLLGRLDNIING